MTFAPPMKAHLFPSQTLLLSFLAVLWTLCQGLSPNIRFEGLMCKDHPAFNRRWKPVLIRSWVLDRLSSSDFEQEAYIVGHTDHVYAPPSDRTSRKYLGLDLFFMAGKTRYPNVRMYFQRDVKVFMLVTVSRRDYDPASFASILGWQSEGWAILEKGGETITYGVHVRRRSKLPKFVYVFSKLSTDKKIDIPQTLFVKNRIDGITVPGSFNLLIAERNGKRSPPVGRFRRRKVRPNKPCPAKLHDSWYAVDNNPDDSHTAGMRFNTWHPTWDPCHWCAYDHDHGSSPKHLFGYDPKFNYVALKNDNEDESHRGFKGFVFETKKHFVYYNLHAATSSLRRVTGRFHTVHLVILDKSTRAIVVDIAHKGDFGFQSVKLKRGRGLRFSPISAEDRMIMSKQTTNRFFRSINIINRNNLVEDYMYRSPLLLGAYEEWQTIPICGAAMRRQNTFRVLFKQPGTGIKSIEEPDVRIDLGHFVRGQFVKSSSLVRSLLIQPIEISDRHCPDRKNGYFYTDAFGRPTDGPSETSLRQYIEPGFSVTLQGSFEPEETWVGLHGNFRRGFLVDHCYGINPDLN